ncbi:MAG: response regulator [Candidatus Kapaibacterium sp.]
MHPSIRVLLVDDHELVRTGVRTLLSSEADIDIVAEAADGGQAVELARRTRPDVVLMDIKMPLMSGYEAVAFIKRELPQTSVMMLATSGEEEVIRKALDVGADGYLVKDVLPEELIMAVRSVGLGERVLSGTAQRALEMAKKPVSGGGDGLPLTKRERQIVTMVTSGFTSQQIADHLSISRRTVETHRARIMGKLGVNNAAGLVRLSLTNSPQPKPPSSLTQDP